MDMNSTILGPIVCPVLIGRTSSLAALVQLMEQACSGNGHTALIAGEAGTGKSRLVTEAIQRLRSSRYPAALLLQGRCFEPDRSFPYAPLLDLLRSFLGSHSLDELIALLGPSAPHLVKLLPELATLLPERVSGSILEPVQEKRHLFSALTEVSLRSLQKSELFRRARQLQDERQSASVAA
jgi:predicted ATPase